MRIPFRIDPAFRFRLRQDERHPVMDEGDGFAGLTRKNNEMGKVVFQTVKPAQPGELAAFGHDGVFIPGFGLAGRRGHMLPLVVPGGRDHAAVGCPGVPEAGLLRRGLHTGVGNGAADPRNVKAPDHRENALLSGFAGGNDRHHGIREHLSLRDERLCHFLNTGPVQPRALRRLYDRAQLGGHLHIIAAAHIGNPPV